MLTTIKLSTIQNIEAIVHFHWLRKQHTGVSFDELIAHTASVEYAVTTATQCGYRVSNIRYLDEDECDVPIGGLMEHYEDSNAQREVSHDQLLSRYGFTRETSMLANFGIELSVDPHYAPQATEGE